MEGDNPKRTEAGTSDFARLSAKPKMSVFTVHCLDLFIFKTTKFFRLNG